MNQVNIVAAWVGMIGGIISGAGMGLLFYKEAWLGGYSTWQRRLVRLAHISFFGLAFINLGFGLTVALVEPASLSLWPSRLLIVGAISMPVVCYLAAWKKPLRHLFPIPVMSLATAILFFLFEGGLL